MKVDINIKNKVEKILEDSIKIFVIINEIANCNNKKDFPIEKSLLVKLAICSDTYNELLLNLETTND
ncbi:MAG: hypothetical protein PHY08_12620 [Candidatus Cloacimonetes bacterium]|nr:hypothetical protein [Candidatus Cloacimonadota bacterium]